MKRLVLIISIAVLAMTVLFSGCSSSEKKPQAPAEEKKSEAAKAPSLNGIKEKGRFIVGLDDSFPPMGFRDEKGKIVGFDIDLAEEAAKRLGVGVEFKPVDWDGVLLSLKNKDIDVIWNGLTITDKRKEQIDFSKVYLENKQIIVVKSGASIKSKADLKGKVVGLQQGSSSEEALNADGSTVKSLKSVKKYQNNTEALLDLKNGGNDVVVVDEVVGRYYISKKPGEYAVLDEDFGKESYGVGIRKEDKEFREALDKVLDEMKADGTADKISEKWFGKGIVKK